MNQIFMTLVIDTPTKTKTIKAWVDTGYNQFLILNYKLAQTLNLKPIGKTRIVLGNNRTDTGIIAEADILISLNEKDYKFEKIKALVLEREPEPIVGFALLRRIQEQTGFKTILDCLKSKATFAS